MKHTRNHIHLLIGGTTPIYISQIASKIFHFKKAISKSQSLNLEDVVCSAMSLLLKKNTSLLWGWKEQNGERVLGRSIHHHVLVSSH